MYPGKKTSNFYDYTNRDMAAGRGYFGLIKERDAINKGFIFTSLAVDMACANNHLEIAKYLYYNKPQGCTYLALCSAALGGYMEIIKWLCLEIRIEIVAIGIHTRKTIATACMSTAVQGGNLEIVLFLHEYLGNYDIFKVINKAITTGQLKMVKLLIPFVDILEIKQLMKVATESKDIAIVKFIYGVINDTVNKASKEKEFFEIMSSIYC